MGRKKNEMLMCKSDFVKQIGRLRAVYRNDWFFQDPETTMQEWYAELGDVSPNQLADAVTYWIRNNKNEPVPSDLIAIIEMSGVDKYGKIGDPTKWPLWIVVDNGNGRIIDRCFAPEIIDMDHMAKWFRQHGTDLFGTTLKQSSYDAVYVREEYEQPPKQLPEGFSSWKEWAIDRMRRIGHGTIN